MYVPPAFVCAPVTTHPPQTLLNLLQLLSVPQGQKKDIKGNDKRKSWRTRNRYTSKGNYERKRRVGEDGKVW